jgi:aspartyl-tRNA(Asn)/glutamyl-tRNA(Gln) amidotransferase subunit C
MSLNEKEIHKIHELAMLERDENDEHLIKEVSQIMDFIEQLRSVDTSQIEPLYRPFELYQPLREDIPSQENCLNELKSIAPAFEDDLYIVPTVIETDN